MQDVTHRMAPTGTQFAPTAVEWSTVRLICACYATWLVAGILYAAAPFVAVPLLAIAIVLHSSLQHEAIHRHPTGSDRWNEALVWLPLGLLVPYRRYRRQHLLHHVDSRLTDPYDDPESFYLALGDWQRLPRFLQRLLAWNNRLAVRILIGPAIGAIVFLAKEIRAVAWQADRRERRLARLAWAAHAVGLAALGAIVHFAFAMPIGAYLLAAYMGLAILAIRSFCEHQSADDPAHRTVIVENSLLGLLFLNNNLHLVHHAQPRLPWYALPAAYRARREEWHRINGGYVFQGYGMVLRRFAFRAKEPVAHPIRISRYSPRYSPKPAGCPDPERVIEASVALRSSRGAG